MNTNLTFIRIGDKEVKSGGISLLNPLAFNKNDGMIILLAEQSYQREFIELM